MLINTRMTEDGVVCTLPHGEEIEIQMYTAQGINTLADPNNEEAEDIITELVLDAVHHLGMFANDSAP